MERPAYVRDLGDLLGRGDIDGFVRRCQENIQLVEGQLADAYPETAYVREDLARAYYELDDYFSAESQFRRALEIHRQHGQVVSDDAARCLGMLGRLALWTGRTAEAELLFCEALTLLDHVPADKQTSRGFVLIDLAQLHTWEGEYETAERLLHEAARQHLRSMGYCPGRLAFVYLHLSRAYLGQGRTSAADKTLNKAIRYCIRGREVESANFAALLTERGLLLERQQKVTNARGWHSAALRILQRVRPHGCKLLERVQGRLARLAET
ncbi:MAG TPA: tetratricopeptide repeat protein, partial [Pirellulaceae bacterium]|nr:tetratricopeptide repeat protein [Pirellulaceae bacterium]